MGYESKVGISMPEPDYRTMLSLLGEIKNKKQAAKINAKTADDVINLVTKYADKNDIVEFEDGQKIRYLFWDWQKWYEDFPDVGWLMRYVRNLPDYEYIRVGEELTDIERKYPNEYSAVIDVSRDICLMEW